MTSSQDRRQLVALHSAKVLLLIFFLFILDITAASESPYDRYAHHHYGRHHHRRKKVSEFIHVTDLHFDRYYRVGGSVATGCHLVHRDALSMLKALEAEHSKATKSSELEAALDGSDQDEAELRRGRRDADLAEAQGDASVGQTFGLRGVTCDSPLQLVRAAFRFINTLEELSQREKHTLLQKERYPMFILWYVALRGVRCLACCSPHSRLFAVGLATLCDTRTMNASHRPRR